MLKNRWVNGELCFSKLFKKKFVLIRGYYVDILTKTKYRPVYFPNNDLIKCKPIKYKIGKTKIIIKK